ncbi:MAG: phosphoribosylanthranilate isomerase [Pirellulales bacterium]|nr:phosphoribosylanthranilate isomerase [Pirellulales bacterium]
MFRIKICGITNLDDALVAADAGADAIGFNFCTRSPRFIEPLAARDIAARLPRGVARVGVFVNATDGAIVAAADLVALDIIQLHGDEPPDEVRALAPRQVMRAIRAATNNLSEVSRYLERCRKVGAELVAIMADAAVAGQYGGTGQRADWEAWSHYASKPRVPPLVLAGGLTPENVAEGIARVRPAAVDVASGVESEPGIKDQAKVKQFVDAARAAFTRHE